MGALAAIARFPVKGLGGETLASATLLEGRGVEGDRVFGFAHAVSEAAPEGWARPREFATPRRAPELARVAVSLRAGGLLAASHGMLGDIQGEPDALADWLGPLAGPMAPLRLVRAGAGAIHDTPEGHVSVGSLASLRALSDLAGVAPDPRRFRMNLWLEGFAPWEERGWSGIVLDPVRLRVIAPVERCAAPDANPETGRRDADLCGALHARFGHAEFGVYAQVETGGEIAPGAEAQAT
ncbi:MAG: MOSC domain-containing protein [Pikeienuella sp.]|uniref:MOSC domain-containing protein n=1 Tax=Pikeienuella sp. TaxID=2831957 RepID=UPI00391DDBA9